MEEQQLQPQRPPSSHWIGIHAPLLHVSAQPQTGLQVLVGHIPLVHLPPPVQPQTPPQPSAAPQVPSFGHFGVQQLPP
jgi:hypothetical protein